MLTKLVRIGRDAVVRALPNGTAVMDFPAVYDIGFGDKKRAQWIKCTMFGDRCHKVAEYMLKGKQIVIYAEDVGIEEWVKNDGSGDKGVTMSCKLVSFDFVSGGELAQQPQTQQRPQAQQQPQQPQQQAPPQNQPSGAHQQAPNNMDQFDDDIPFS
jgi:single-strand DNA-binding protein